MTARKPPQQTSVTAARRRAWSELCRRLIAPPLEPEQGKASAAPAPSPDQRGGR
jgi:hypothetical protein